MLFGPFGAVPRNLVISLRPVTLHQVVVEVFMPEMVGEFQLVKNENAQRNEQIIQNAAAC